MLALVIVIILIPATPFIDLILSRRLATRLSNRCNNINMVVRLIFDTNCYPPQEPQSPVSLLYYVILFIALSCSQASPRIRLMMLPRRVWALKSLLLFHDDDIEERCRRLGPRDFSLNRHYISIGSLYSRAF